MTDTEYREFWEKFLGRYPEFNPNAVQTEDWHRELHHKDAATMEASVATVITEKTSTIPKLPWFLAAYKRIWNERHSDRVSSGNNTPIWREDPGEWEDIIRERKEHLEQLQAASIDDLRTATVSALKRYKLALHSHSPDSADVTKWSKWLRCAVWHEMFC